MLDETLIKRYAEKIYGFAYSKTRKTTDAADLSQEILLNLCTVDLSGVANMDAFIYTVCRYTWSKFLAKNKREWDSVTPSGEIGDYFEFRDDITPEKLVIENEDYEKIRREVMYLSGIRRDIIIMKYYDRLNAAEIGKRLGINPSTVRWHLSKIRNDLKERIDMKDEIYRPQKLSFSNYGPICYNHTYNTYTNLKNDVLMQNICIVCRNNAKTIEEISHILGVAAFYIEDKLSSLCSMDYMSKEHGKYLTNFFIKDIDFIIADTKYEFIHSKNIAEIYCKSVKSVLPDLKKVGFAGYDLDDNQLMWDILIYFLHHEIKQTQNDLGIKIDLPMRADGSRQLITASVSKNTVLENPKFPEELREFYQATNSSKRYKSFNASIMSMKYSCLGFINLNGFDSYKNIIWKKISELQRKNEPIPFLDRETFAELACKKYITITDDHYCRMNFPYFTYTEKLKINDILQNCVSKSDRDKIYCIFSNYADYIDKFIPTSTLPNNLKNIKLLFTPHVAILWYLLKEGHLSFPENPDAACAIAYEEYEAE